MFIQEIVSQHRSDFVAIMECEHCNATHRLTSGYDDDFYHARVIPAMVCKSCKKNRSGAVIEPPTSETQHIAETLDQ
jgi:hypothetical protein